MFDSVFVYWLTSRREYFTYLKTLQNKTYRSYNYKNLQKFTFQESMSDKFCTLTKFRCMFVKDCYRKGAFIKTNKHKLGNGVYTCKSRLFCVLPNN